MPENNAAAHFLVRSIGRPYLRFAEGISRIEISGMEHYEGAARGFLDGKWRLIIPFRHVSKADAAVIGTLFARIIPDRLKVRDRRFWISFLYGDMVLDWAGAAARWLFPRIGALPVSNQRLVREQILAIRHLLSKGDYPLCLAPEGQVNYYNDRPGPLTEGLTHFIRWILGEDKSVQLLPVKIHYRYRRPQSIIDRALREVSEFTGRSCGSLDEAVAVMTGWLREYLSSGASSMQASAGAHLEAIRSIITREALESYPIGGRKALAELFLFRHHVFSEMRSRSISVPAMAERIAKQWQKPDGLSRLEKNYQQQQILDIMLNFDPEYHKSEASPLEDEAMNRQAEQALYLLDIMNRIRGGDINSRFFPSGTTAIIRFRSPRLFTPGDDPEQWKSIFP